MSHNDPRSEASKKRDLIARGDYTPTPAGKAAFFILRAIDPTIQYGILAHGIGTPLLHRLGLRTLPPGLATRTGIAAIDGLGLSPYRLILLGMTVGSVVKQNIWVTFLSGEPMPIGSAVAVSAYNTIVNGINNYAFLLTAIEVVRRVIRRGCKLQNNPTSASCYNDRPRRALALIVNCPL